MLGNWRKPSGNAPHVAESEAQAEAHGGGRTQAEPSTVISNANLPGDGAGARSKRRRKPGVVYRQATAATTLLFLLVFTGPPKFRIRDPEASLRGDVDWVVILHIVVWGTAGAWVLYELARPGRVTRLAKRLSLAQKLGLGIMLCLAVSAVISNAPIFSLFKIYQMAVTLLFVQIFVERFGYASCLKRIFWGTALLCGVIAVCAFLAPDAVWIASDFNPDPSRLVGYLIAPTGSVSVFALILLLTGVRRIWRVVPLALLSMCLWLLVFSLMRTAYLVMLGFVALALVKRPNAKALKQFAYVSGALALGSYAYQWLPKLSNYRQPEDVASLGDRLGLWSYLSNITLMHSPWLGLGYYTASRLYGPLYNPGLGNAHSMFFEILLGGGVLTFALFMALCIMLSVQAAYLLYKNKDRFTFAVATLFFAGLVFGAMGDDIDSGPVAMCFWYAASALPLLYERSMKRTLQARGARVHATA
ncbi:MAG: O-antigen ligase family protein [Candidatus Acidiferrum sp.]